MDIDTCITKYIELSSTAFQLKRSRVNVLGKLKDFLKVKGAYRSEALESEFKKVALAVEGNADAKLLRPDATCKSYVSSPLRCRSAGALSEFDHLIYQINNSRFVCAFNKALNTPVRLRTYATEDSVDALSSHECTIWEAARATSAAATFFDPIQIGRQQFVDGATGLNNPVEVVLEEARSLWPGLLVRIQCVLSIGTGIPDLKDFGSDMKQVLQTLKSIATETEETEKRLFKNQGHLGIGGHYFRFNVDKGLGGVGLDEHEKVDQIEAGTELYLADPRVRETAKLFCTVRAPQDCT